MTKTKETIPERIRKRQRAEDVNIFSRLQAAHFASRNQAQRFLKLGGGLSVVEWRTLWDLAEAGPMSIRDLTQIQRTDHSLLSRALPAMQSKGYVKKLRDDTDKRQTLVDITAAGRAAYEQAAPIMARRREALRAALSEDEIGTLLDLLNKLEHFLHTGADDIVNTEMPS